MLQCTPNTSIHMNTFQIASRRGAFGIARLARWWQGGNTYPTLSKMEKNWREGATTTTVNGHMDKQLCEVVNRHTNSLNKYKSIIESSELLELSLCTMKWSVCIKSDIYKLGWNISLILCKGNALCILLCGISGRHAPKVQMKTKCN